jgi:hypothetical protein
MRGRRADDAHVAQRRRKVRAGASPPFAKRRGIDVGIREHGEAVGRRGTDRATAAADVPRLTPASAATAATSCCAGPGDTIRSSVRSGSQPSASAAGNVVVGRTGVEQEATQVGPHPAIVLRPSPVRR